MKKIYYYINNRVIQKKTNKYLQCEKGIKVQLIEDNSK